MSEKTEILVVGGGLVGSSLAIALDAAGRDVLMVEARAPGGEARPSYDERNLALARASVNGLRQIGVWPLAEPAATPIESIHVSRAGAFGATRLCAADIGVRNLGWTLPARELGAALSECLAACSHLRRLAPARVRALKRDGQAWTADIDTDEGPRQVQAQLLVGADGSDSGVRETLGLGAEIHDYGQSLFVTTLSPERDHEGRAFERFTEAGPIALLPLTNRRVGLVLTVAAADAARVAALDDAAFLALAQQRFGWRLGRLSHPGRRKPYPIRRIFARSLHAERAVLVGNAAQTVHPIGAQGFNLGLRDALTLAEMLDQAGDVSALSLVDYAARREPDRRGVAAMSHGLIRLACHESAWLQPCASLGLLAFEHLAPLKRALLRRGMGFRGTLPDAVLERSP